VRPFCATFSEKVAKKIYDRLFVNKKQLKPTAVTAVLQPPATPALRRGGRQMKECKLLKPTKI
jgi:hypothetical protein